MEELHELLFSAYMAGFGAGNAYYWAGSTDEEYRRYVEDSFARWLTHGRRELP